MKPLPRPQQRSRSPSPPPTRRPRSRSRTTMASSSSAPVSWSSGYVCDTLPPARILQRQTSRSPSPLPPPTPPVTAFAAPITDSMPTAVDFLPSQTAGAPTAGTSQIAPPPGRKLCVRHQRMADEGTNLKLQQVSVCCTVAFLVVPHPCFGVVACGTAGC